MSSDPPMTPLGTGRRYQYSLTPDNASPLGVYAAPSSSVSSPGQPRLRAARLNRFQKTDIVIKAISTHFDSLGEFLEYLFYHRPSKDRNGHRPHDPRSSSHQRMVTRFLQGHNKVKMGDIIDLIYSHKQSQPAFDSPLVSERELAFAPYVKHSDVHHARISLSVWATRLVGDATYAEVGNATHNNPNDPNDRTQIRATTNGRQVARNPNIPALTTWDDILRMDIQKIHAKYTQRLPIAMYLTECMAAPCKDGIVIVRQRRPHPTIQVGALNAFIFSRNRYASGYLGIPLAIWEFACQAHVDIKRIFCRFGYGIHDSTARKLLKTLSQNSLIALRKDIADGLANGEMRYCFIQDNVQYMAHPTEQRIGKADQMKVGTACTAIRLQDCAPDAFNLQDHLDRVRKQERLTMTASSFFKDIDWVHQANVQALHWVNVLVTTLPPLNHLSKEVSDAFRNKPISKHPMREGRPPTHVQALGTNGEHDIETEGMKKSMLDFENQSGLTEDIPQLENLMIPHRGDGGSFAAMLRVKKYHAPETSNYRSFRNRLTWGPEVWHARSTNLGAIAFNHFGPASSSDPSSLSKTVAAVNFKRPSNLKSPDFYPTRETVTVAWNTRVLDCWRIHFGSEDILTHFDDLPTESLPSFAELYSTAQVLVRRYASQQAYERALSKAESEEEGTMRIRSGSTWQGMSDTTPEVTEDHNIDAEATMAVDQDAEIVHPTIMTHAEREANEEDIAKERGEHKEEPGFAGDRVLTNEILFLMEAGLWIEADSAVPEGDMGRVWEILKIWAIMFTGTANRNYSEYLLEMYCILRYESSKSLKNAILNNILVNLTGLPGDWLEGDLLQEHYNRWLEEDVQHKGGEFDDEFYRSTISPNVNHFLRIKEMMETAFGLKPRTKSHGSSHLRSEYQELLRMYREMELHLFRSGRSMGHAAVNLLLRGFKRLDSGRMTTFLERSTAYSDILGDVIPAPRQSYPVLVGASPLYGHQSTPSVMAAVLETSDSPDEDEEESIGPDDGSQVHSSEEDSNNGSEIEGGQFVEDEYGNGHNQHLFDGDMGSRESDESGEDDEDDKPVGRTGLDSDED